MMSGSNVLSSSGKRLRSHCRNCKCCPRHLGGSASPSAVSPTAPSCFAIFANLKESTRSCSASTSGESSDIMQLNAADSWRLTLRDSRRPHIVDGGSRMAPCRVADSQVSFHVELVRVGPMVEQVLDHLDGITSVGEDVKRCCASASRSAFTNSVRFAETAIHRAVFPSMSLTFTLAPPFSAASALTSPSSTEEKAMSSESLTSCSVSWAPSSFSTLARLNLRDC
mmetsp:Transcript_69861/g.146046  ORF Transcript_69861/g.146046 Transcript_69861/m.146046 type:complete len:225 (-) Transcript_69861:557-1231(-)